MQPAPKLVVRKPRTITRLVIHRIKVSHVGYTDDASGIAAFFARHPEGIKATGGRMAYHFVVRKDGIVEQAVDIETSAPHARAYNGSSIGVAVIGDFTRERPTEAQLWGLMRCLSKLHALYPKAVIVSHDSLPGGSTDPDKRCPGPYVDVHAIARAVEAIGLVQTSG